MSKVQVRMSRYEKLVKLFDEEVDEQRTLALNDYAEVISKKHAIPLELFLKDIPKSCTSTICRGTKSSGDRCTFRGVYNGYCRHHKAQGERICQRSLSSSSLHNHGPEQMFVRNCPGCNNGLIELNTII